MPSNEQSFRFQKAVVWLAVGVDNHGNIKVSTTPIELDVRWETSKRQSFDASNETVSVSVELHTEDELPIGTQVWEGCLDELPSPLTLITNIHRVIGYDRIPDVKGRNFEVTTLCTRSSNQVTPQ